MWADAVDWDGWEVWTESWGVGFCMGVDTPINQEQGVQARRRRTAFEKTQRLVDLWGPQRCGANWRKNIWAGGAGAQASFIGKCISWQETVQRLPGCLSSEEEGTTEEGEMGMEWRLLCWVMLLSSLGSLVESGRSEGQQQLGAIGSIFINGQQMLGDHLQGMQSRQALNG